MDRIQFSFEIMCLPIGFDRPGQHLAIEISNQLDDMVSRQYVKMLADCLVEIIGGKYYVMRNMQGAVRFDLKNAAPEDFRRALEFLLSERE